MTALQIFQPSLLTIRMICDRKLCLSPSGHLSTTSAFSHFTLIILTEPSQVDVTNPLAQPAVNDNKVLNDPYKHNFFIDTAQVKAPFGMILLCRLSIPCRMIPGE